MIFKVLKPVAAILVLTLFVYQPCVYAASIPSKTDKDQALAARAAELVFARSLFATDRIANALAAEGLTPEQIEARLAVLSTPDIISLAENSAQVRSAGISMTKRTWTIVGIAAAALVIGGLALHSDDAEDDDTVDD